jgi:cytochrome P450
MLRFHSDEMLRDPFPVYDRIRSEGGLLHEPRADLWLLFDHESVKRVLTDHDGFSSAVSPAEARSARWLLFTDPPRHTRLRTLIARAFTPRAVASLEPRIRALSTSLLEPALARGELDLVADFAVPLPLMVIAEMLGAPVADLDHFRRWSDAVVSLALSVTGDAGAAQAEQAFRDTTDEMQAYLAALTRARRASPADDLLTRLVEVEVDGERLTDDELLGFFQLLLVAGHETTTNLIDNAILCFLDHPDELARVRADPTLLPGAIEEVLRHRSPVQAMFRMTRRDATIRGRTIPAGKLVLAMIGAANRDPLVFPDPARFDITRTPNPHIAFGHGIHFCIGAALARLEARVALGDLLTRTRRIDHASDQPWTPRKAFHIHGPAHLPLRISPR